MTKRAAPKAERKSKLPKYEMVVGLTKGHKVTKNERKKPRPSQQKGVSYTHQDIITLFQYLSMHLSNPLTCLPSNSIPLFLID